jgi:hypothetical protein
MSRKQRAQSLREAKDRRMKMIAAGGAVLLVAVLAFEVPKMMHKNSSSTPPPATTTTTGAPTGSAPATTAPGTASAAVMPTAASTKLPNSETPPRPGKSQLFSFTHFSGKDPFVQQIAATTSSSSSSSSSSSGASRRTGSTQPTAKVTLNHQSSRTLAVSGAATVSVNGRTQVVRVGGRFPSANPLFRLVGITHGVAQIAIANGSYTSGAHAVSLRTGRTMTLVDTADGVRYRIRLLSAA